MNDDTIYRQAAIACAVSGLTREIDGEKWIRVSEVRESIKEMPSADPDVITMRVDIDKEQFEKAWKQALANSPLTVSPPENDGWIPVTERMPEEYTRVIGYMAWKAMTTIEYQHGRWYSIDHLEPLPDEAVSHWMPLPKPPKEGDE